MGNYNPYRPVILGNEWPGIRSEPYQLDAITERGHTFTIDSSTTVVSGSAFLSQDPNVVPLYNGIVISIYPRDDEASSGPIQKVRIPCAGGMTVTGTFFEPVTPSGASNVGAAVRSLATFSYASYGYDYAADSGQVLSALFSFDVSSVASVLDDKRILELGVVHLSAGASSVGGGVTKVNTSSDITSINGAYTISLGTGVNGETALITIDSAPEIALTVDQNTGVSYIPVGNLDFLHPDTITPNAYPFRYEDLLKLAPGGSPQFHVRVAGRNLWSAIVDTDAEIPNNAINLYYLALEVTYCQETRLGYGGRSGRYWDGVTYQSFRTGQNLIPIRTANTATQGVTLSPGEYTTTVTIGSNAPHNAGATTPIIFTRALRHLYDISSFEGVQLRTSLNVDDVLTREEFDVLPQIMLHTATSAVTGVHAYGQLREAPVYGSTTVRQGILQQSGDAAVAYPYVRFYARRFGNTDVSLTFQRVSDPTKTATISVAEFDELDLVVDGWKEVTLPFTSVPTFANTGAVDAWQWSAAGLVYGNHWEILAVDVNSFSGNPYACSPATYGGSTASLTTSAPVTGADAVVFFSQDPPAVTGLAISLESQAITGVGDACGGESHRCTPTGIDYAQITWGPLSSTFGIKSFELQRSDDVDETWHTIMLSSAVTGVAEFNDYEARVGVESHYRIRTVNVYDFVGPWSSTVSATIPAPGVTTTGDGNGVLIFTSNANQDGISNLAYVMAWQTGDVTESFTFPEADEVITVRRYQQDYVTAFRPTERGGEQFSRTLLVRDVAVSSGRIREGFRSLRDMAWRQLPYVCVRNELGDRWLATVIVPEGQIRRNRQIFLARVDIIEVTDTPAVIDPLTSDPE